MPRESPKFKKAHWRGEIRPKMMAVSSGPAGISLSRVGRCPISVVGTPLHTQPGWQAIWASLGTQGNGSTSEFSLLLDKGEAPRQHHRAWSLDDQDTARWKNDKIHCRSGRLGQHSYLLPPLSDHSPHSHFHSFSSSFTRFDIIWPNLSFLEILCEHWTRFPTRSRHHIHAKIHDSVCTKVHIQKHGVWGFFGRTQHLRLYCRNCAKKAVRQLCRMDQ